MAQVRTGPEGGKSVKFPLVLGDPENAVWADGADIVIIGFGSPGAEGERYMKEDANYAVLARPCQSGKITARG